MLGSIVGGVLGLGGAAMGARSQSRAAEAAAKAQAEANKMAIEEQRRQFDLSRETLNPFVQAGLGGLGVPTNAADSAASGTNMAVASSTAPAVQTMQDPRDIWPEVFVPREPRKPKKQRFMNAAGYKNLLIRSGYSEKKREYDFAIEQKKKRDAQIAKYDRWVKKQSEQPKQETVVSAKPPEVQSLQSAMIGAGKRRRVPPNKQTVKPMQATPVQAQAPAQAPIPQTVVTPTEEFVSMTPQQQEMQMDGGLIGTYQSPNPVSFMPQGGLAQTAYTGGTDLSHLGGLGGAIPMVQQWQQPQWQQQNIPLVPRTGY